MIETVYLQVTVKGFGRAEDVSSEQHARSVAEYVREHLVAHLHVQSENDIEVEPILEIIDAS